MLNRNRYTGHRGPTWNTISEMLYSVQYEFVILFEGGLRKGGFGRTPLVTGLSILVDSDKYIEAYKLALAQGLRTKGSSIIIIIFMSVQSVRWGGGGQGRPYAFLNVVF